jgi:hypothetical protein
MWQASNEIVVYLDGDLSQLCDDLIERLTQPIRDGKAEFVKASFSRQAGRVTSLTSAARRMRPHPVGGRYPLHSPFQTEVRKFLRAARIPFVGRWIGACSGKKVFMFADMLRSWTRGQYNRPHRS